MGLFSWLFGPSPVQKLFRQMDDMALDTAMLRDGWKLYPQDATDEEKQRALVSYMRGGAPQWFPASTAEETVKGSRFDWHDGKEYIYDYGDQYAYSIDGTRSIDVQEIPSTEDAHLLKTAPYERGDGDIAVEMSENMKHLLDNLM